MNTLPSPQEASNELREFVIGVMMGIGVFSPHTREEAEKMYDATAKEIRMKNKLANHMNKKLYG